MTIDERFFPEMEIDHFSFVSGTILFYLKVKALYGTGPRVLDYGAGRGAWTLSDPSRTSRNLRDLRIGASETVAADIDEAVLENPACDRRVVLEMDKPLPFEDGYFDIIVSDYVFEHVTNPAMVAGELLRVLKPGGWICARTANKYGYIALLSRLVPNALHRAVLRTVQPHRAEVDVFPTTYALCTRRAVRKHFPGKKVIATRMFAEPSYHFNNSWIYGFLLILHRILPKTVAPGVTFFIQK